MSDDYYSIRRVFDESVLEHRAKVEAFIEQYILDSLPTSSYSQYSKNRVENMIRELAEQIVEITREAISKMQIKATKRMASSISEAQQGTLNRIKDLETELNRFRTQNQNLGSEVRALQSKNQEKEGIIEQMNNELMELQTIFQQFTQQDYANRIKTLETTLTQTQEQYKALQAKYQNEKEQWELKFIDQAKKIENLEKNQK
ncbi:MAG: hypothetical protein ACFFCZ_07005 [Promethearchaeota archaeon]